MKSQGGSQSQSKHTICICSLVHFSSFQLQATVIVLSFREMHPEGFHGKANQARTRLCDLMDSFGIPVGFVCCVLGEAAKKHAQKEMLRKFTEVHRLSQFQFVCTCLWSSIHCWIIISSAFFGRATFLDGFEIKHL